MYIHFETGQVWYHRQHQRHCRIRSKKFRNSPYAYYAITLNMQEKALVTNLSCRPPVFLAIGIEPYLIAIICTKVLSFIQHKTSKYIT